MFPLHFNEDKWHITMNEIKLLPLLYQKRIDIQDITLLNEKDFVIKGTGGNLKRAERPLYVGNAGTVLRFFLPTLFSREEFA